MSALNVKDVIAQVIVYANPFTSPHRLEVLIDWSDNQPWPAQEWIQKPVGFNVMIVANPEAPDLWANPDCLKDMKVLSIGKNLSDSFLDVNTRVRHARLIKEVYQSVWGTGEHHLAMKKSTREFAFQNFQNQFTRKGPVTYVEGPTFASSYLRNLADGKHSNLSEEVSRELVEYADLALKWNEHLANPVAEIEKVRAADVSGAGKNVPRTALRKICRDEPTMGHLFHVMHYLQMPSGLPRLKVDWKRFLDGAPANSRLWLVAAPMIDGAVLAQAYVPLPTCMGFFPTNRSDQVDVISLLHPSGIEAIPNPYNDDQAKQNGRSFYGKIRDVSLMSGFPLSEDGPPEADEKFVESLVEERSLAAVVSLKSLEAAAVKCCHKIFDGEVFQDINTKRAKERDWISSRTDAVRAIVENRYPHDSIGLSWEFERPDRQAEKFKCQSGFKGYRVDVRSVKDGSADIANAKWRSLCLLYRTVGNTKKFGHVVECIDGSTWGESNLRESYVDEPVQGAPGQGGAPKQLLVAKEFVIWKGSSIVEAFPLDRLGVIKDQSTRSNEEDSENTLRYYDKIPKSVPNLHYGNIYQFRVRKIGLSGLGPSVDTGSEYLGLPSTEALDIRKTVVDIDRIQFFRTIKMAAPAVKVHFSRNVERMEAAQREQINMPYEELPASDGIYRIVPKSDSSYLYLEARLPLAHYRVALHARVRGEDTSGSIDNDLQEAADNYAQRLYRACKDASNQPDSVSHLSAVDPHTIGISVESQVWYPFSDGKCDEDRYMSTGASAHSVTEVEIMSFGQLVAKGEELIHNGLFPIKYQIPISHTPGLPKKNENRAVRLCLGVRNRITCKGIWSDRGLEVLHPSMRRGDRPKTLVWNGHYTVLAEGQRLPLGGRVSTPTHSTARVTRYYCGLGAESILVKGQSSLKEQWQNERLLVFPPKPWNTSDSTNKRQERVTVNSWRRYAFSDVPPQTESHKTWTSQVVTDSYRRFVAGLLHAKIEDSSGADDGALHVSFATTLSVSMQSENQKVGPKTVVPAFTFPGNIKTEEHVPKVSWSRCDSTGSKILAYLGNLGGDEDAKPRRLPFIEDEIAWVVRLSWWVPLEGSPIERPRDLAAVKEFRLYRKQHGEPLAPREKPIAVIPRPSDTFLMQANLDEIEWTWFDAIQSPTGHSYDYYIVAYPEYPDQFDEQVWFVFKNVVVPNTTYDAAPEKVLALPLLNEPAVSKRKILLYLPPSGKDVEAARLAFRVSAISTDPILMSPDRADNAAVTQAGYSPSLEALFSSNLLRLTEDDCRADGAACLAAIPLDPINFSVFNRPNRSEDWRFARSCKEDTHTSVASNDSPAADDRTVQNSHILYECSVDLKNFGIKHDLENPFFKLQLSFYHADKYPRLKHTAASDVFETEWLQFYSSQLEKPSWHSETQTVHLAGAGLKGDLVRFRFHFFVHSSESVDKSGAFHISTFISPEPKLSFHLIRPELEAALIKYLMEIPANCTLMVLGDFGLQAFTYKLKNINNVDYDESPEFVVLRSSRQALSLLIDSQGGRTIDAVKLGL